MMGVSPTISIIFAEHFQPDAPRLVNKLLSDGHCKTFCHELDYKLNVYDAIAVSQKNKQARLISAAITAARNTTEDELITVLQKTNGSEDLKYHGIDMEKSEKHKFMRAMWERLPAGRHNAPLGSIIDVAYGSKDVAATANSYLPGQLRKLDPTDWSALKKAENDCNDELSKMRDVWMANGIIALAEANKDGIVVLLGPAHIHMLDVLRKRSQKVYENIDSYVVCSEIRGVDNCRGILDLYKDKITEHGIVEYKPLKPITKPPRISTEVSVAAATVVGFLAGGPVGAAFGAVAGCGYKRAIQTAISAAHSVVQSCRMS